MAWFRLDDKFHGHPKVILAGNAAIGLYVRCGAYASDHLTNGFIAAHVARNLGNRREIATLVNAELWAVVDGGYRMPDYLEYNPSAADVEAERAAARERMRKAREAKRSGSVRANNERSSPEVRKCSDNPVPTRPDPVSTSVVALGTDPPVSDAGEATTDDLEHVADVLAALAVLQPKWPADLTARTVRRAFAQSGSWKQTAVAALSVARDPATRTPARMLEDGHWWQQLAADDTRSIPELIDVWSQPARPHLGVVR